ncbi:MAG: thioredoxin family protein [Deltaproteobacteria bacterium]|nr:thioredoxin family protein [Deltaproteobacteria bacterium]
MACSDEIWVIGTEPPCPRCDYLYHMVHDLVNQLDLPLRIRHLAYTEAEAKEFAQSLGLQPGTAKDVAAKAGIEMDWDGVYQLIERSREPISDSGAETCCPTGPGAKWTPELDEALRPCEEKAPGAGIMMTPVLILAGRLYHQGSVPPRERVLSWIEEAFNRDAAMKPRSCVIEVLGPGCKNCETLYRNVFKALDRLGFTDRVQVKKRTDVDYFMEKGVYMTPGLVIDGEVVSKGKTLNPEQILEILSGRISA